MRAVVLREDEIAQEIWDCRRDGIELYEDDFDLTFDTEHEEDEKTNGHCYEEVMDAVLLSVDGTAVYWRDLNNEYVADVKIDDYLSLLVSLSGSRDRSLFFKIVRSINLDNKGSVSILMRKDGMFDVYGVSAASDKKAHCIARTLCQLKYVEGEINIDEDVSVSLSLHGTLNKSLLGRLLRSVSL